MFEKVPTSALLPEGTAPCREAGAPAGHSDPGGALQWLRRLRPTSLGTEHCCPMLGPSCLTHPQPALRASCTGVHPACLSTAPQCDSCCVLCEYEVAWFIANSHKLIYQQYSPSIVTQCSIHI